MKNLFPNFSGLLLALGCLTLASCDKNSETEVTPIRELQTVNFELGMTGYRGEPTVVARIGVATTEDEARKGKGTLLTGKISYSDTKGGKETRTFNLPNQTKDTKRWVYVSTAKKPVDDQAITLNWNVNDMLTLNASSSDTIVVKQFVVQ